ncbi:hypothetical protein J4443_02535 [Candidatus Woesearchaeota archaeon]|nr:hypothetical protein [Candidatus Woesearchaeota archaeon]
MRIKFKKGKQRWLMEKAIKKAGSERKLKKILKIPNQTVNHYRTEYVNISKKRLDLIINFLGIKINDVDKLIEKKLDENWGRHKGGRDLIQKHKSKGTYEIYIKHLQKRGKIIFTQMHKNMKKKDPENYYRIQYEKFKKVGRYKFITKRGEKVRNKLEKDTADLLNFLKLKYSYEPYIVANKRVYFPDFKVGKLILECTAWRGYLKVRKLKRKLKDFEKEGFNVRFIIPEDIKKFYKPFEDKIITGLKEASVAQTIRGLSR